MKILLKVNWLNDYGNVCNSCTIYIVIFVIALLIIIDICTAYFHFHWSLKRDNTSLNTYVNANNEAIFY